MLSFIQTTVYQVSTIFKALSWNKNPEMVKSFAVQIQSTFVEYCHVRHYDMLSLISLKGYNTRWETFPKRSGG